MKSIGELKFFVAALLLFANACFAQTTTMDVCMEIVNKGLREYSIDKGSSAYLNTVYDKFCESSGSANASSVGLGFDTLIQAVPVSFTGSYTNTETAQRNFCRNYQSLAAARTETTKYQETIVRRGYDSVDTCVAMASEGVSLRHNLTSKNTLNFFITPGRVRPVTISGVAMPPDVECMGQMPDDKATAVKLNQHTRVKLSGADAFSFACTRSGSITGRVTRYNEAVITVLTDISPNGNYSVFLPREDTFSSDSAVDIERRINELGAAAAQDRAKAAGINARFDKVRLSSVCTGDGWLPRGTPGACPAGTRDSGLFLSHSAPGGRGGFGGSCRVCSTVDP